MEQEVAGGSITAEWVSLPPDLVRLVADCVLSNSGVDGYMGMIAVCPSWRSAVAKPSPHAAVADLRFRPRQSVLLHGANDQEGRPLFLNVTTGRFRRLRLPVLRGCFFIGASDGLLVLGGHVVRLLNPLTGDMFHFVETAVAGTEPTIIFSCRPHLFSVYCPLERGCDDAVYSADPTGGLRVVKVHDAALNKEGLFLCSVYCPLERGCDDAFYSADPTGELRVVKVHDAAFNEEDVLFLESRVTYAGNVYVITSGGTLSKIIWTGGHWYEEQIMEIEDDYTASLAESAGKLLLVKEGSETIQVFSIDVKRKVVEPIKSLGSSTLFLSLGNCMVVDADKLPSIKRNNIYGTLLTVHRIDRIYAWCDLSDGKKIVIAVPKVPGDCPGAESGTIYEGPLSLAQVLLTPYPNVNAPVDRFHQS